MKRDRILGIPYENIGTEEALAKVESYVRGSKSHLMVGKQIQGCNLLGKMFKGIFD